MATTMKLSALKQSNLSENYYHSIVISLLRGLAALEVAAAHLRAEVYPGFATISNPTVWFQGLAFFTGFAHLAVVVFFLLSGWLVGGSLLNKFERPGALNDYAIDRMTRLWIVLIPTFAAMLLLGLVTGSLNVGEVSFTKSNEYSAASFLGNLVGLQNILVPNFGGNFPLWSLSNETCYYIMFPMLVVLFTTKSNVVRLLTIALLVGIAHLVSTALLMYFALWLMGAGCSRLRLECTRSVRVVLFVVFAAIAVYFRMKGKTNDLDEQSFLQDFVFSFAFLAFLASMQLRITSTSQWSTQLARVGKFFANFSFTLYVLHIPVIALLVHAVDGMFVGGKLSPHDLGHVAVYGAMFVSMVLVSYLFYLPFEANTQRVRGAIKRLRVGAKSVHQSS